MPALIGFGNHGKDIEAIYLRARHKPLDIYDDDPTTGVDAPPTDLRTRIFIGVNDSKIRRAIAERFVGLRGAHPLVDPSAVLGVDVYLGKGVVVSPGACLLRSVDLGEHVHVHYMASMTRSTIGAFSTICPGATLCGNVEIGEECMIGVNSTICERTSIGNRVIIGAGAIIPPYSNVPDNVTVIGVWRGADHV